MHGSEAIAEAMIAAGCRFFAGYPMTPFTEVLEEMARKLPDVGGVCMNAESELEAVGMAWGAAATGTPAATGSTGQGLSLMQESLAEITLARLPLVVLNMARGQGDYWQATRGGGHGDYRHLVLAPVDVVEAVELVQRAFHLAATWRNPVVVMGDYYLAHTARAVDVAPLDLGPAPPTDWALTGKSGGSGRAKLVSFLGSVKQRDDVGYDLAVHYRACAEHTAAMLRDVPPQVEAGSRRRRRRGGGGVRHAGRLRARRGAVPAGGGAQGRLGAPGDAGALPHRRGRRRRPAGQGRRRLREQHRPDGRRRPSGRPRGGTGGVHRRPEPGSRRASASRPTSTSACCAGASSTWWSGTGERATTPADRAHRPTARARRPGWSTTSPPRWSTSGPISCARGAASPSPSAA